MCWLWTKFLLSIKECTLWTSLLSLHWEMNIRSNKKKEEQKEWDTRKETEKKWEILRQKTIMMKLNEMHLLLGARNEHALQLWPARVRVYMFSLRENDKNESPCCLCPLPITIASSWSGLVGGCALQVLCLPSCFSLLWLLGVTGNCFWFLDHPPACLEGTSVLSPSPSAPRFLSHLAATCSSASRDPLSLSWQDVVSRASVLSFPPPQSLSLTGGFSFAGGFGFAGGCWTHSKTKHKVHSWKKREKDLRDSAVSMAIFAVPTAYAGFIDVCWQLAFKTLGPSMAASRKTGHRSQKLSNFCGFVWEGCWVYVDGFLSLSRMFFSSVKPIISFGSFWFCTLLF